MGKQEPTAQGRVIARRPSAAIGRAFPFNSRTTDISEKLEEMSQKERDLLSIFEKRIETFRLVTAKELAEILGVSEKTIRDWVYKGVIPFEKFNRLVRFNPITIARWRSERK